MCVCFSRCRLLVLEVGDGNSVLAWRIVFFSVGATVLRR